MLMTFIFLPLFSFLFVWLSEIFLGKHKAVLLIAHFYIIIFFFGFLSFIYVCIQGNFYYLTLSTWVNCGLIIVNWGFIFDTLSVSMLFMVVMISGSVHFYSIGYMAEDPSIIRFLSYLSLFTFFMFILVTGDNFIQLFFGWEGIGLCSYLLIGFWNTRVQSNKSAIKALIINRIGDFGFIFGSMLDFYFVRSFDFSIAFLLSPYFKNVTICFFGFRCGCLDVISFYLFIGSMGKSAQVGLHTWLPDAMEGPTPVSALIHAATLVTAGIFLIIRLSPMFEFSKLILVFILFIGGLTTFFGATIAIAQDDIKKVIAYSTCSQLGYMVFICGLSEYGLSMFHLVNHAFFKALLFLSAGSIIHSLSGDQDIRRFGHLTKLLPVTYSMMVLGFLALSGFPFLSGFYSKDLILETSFSKYFINSMFSCWLGSLSAGLTSFYSFRVLYYTFWTKSNSFKYYLQRIHELPKNMCFSLVVLSVGSLFSGYLLKDAFVGVGTTYWGNSIFVLDYNAVGLDLEFIPLNIKNIPLVFSLFGILLAVCFNCCLTSYIKNVKFYKKNYTDTIVFYPQTLYILIWFFFNKWYFDYIYNYYIGYTILNYSYMCFYKLIDKGFIEILSPQGLNNMCYKISILITSGQLGFVYNLSYSLFLGLTLLIFCIIIF
jgi:proton-translocating NADH-quinone oxidoreductase chain L